jgi:asparagine synthase (glutamine-hydrolysing)
MRRARFFAAIQKLPPAHALTVDAAGVRTWPYWRPEEAPPVRLPTDQAYVEKLLEILTDAVAARTRSAYPVAAHASGGLDSSSVAALAARALQQEGRALAGGYSWSPAPVPGEPFLPDDDRLRVLNLAQQAGFPAGFTAVNTRRTARIMLHRRRLPVSTFVQESDICCQAERAGIRTMLSGWGGDQLITLRPGNFYLQLLRRGRWGLMMRELRMRAERAAALWGEWRLGS